MMQVGFASASWLGFPDWTTVPHIKISLAGPRGGNHRVEAFSIDEARKLRDELTVALDEYTRRFSP